MAMRRARSAASRRRRSASARAAAMRSRFDILRGSLRDSLAEARSLRPRRSAFEPRAFAFALRSFFPRRASAARSRFEERESLRDEAVSRPRFPLAVVLAAAAFAAGFLADFAGFLAAACAEAAVKRKMAETANATKRGNRNLGVIGVFLA